MSQLWERRHRRVDYQADVRLVPTQGDAIFGQALNLSTMGMYVAADSLCEVGTIVYCDVPVADRWMRLRGRIAWLRTSHELGMGIEFIDLDAQNFELLGEVVGGPGHQAERVKVWFDGMSQPIRADAIRTKDGICLRTALPFLRLNSNVAFAFAEDGTVEEYAAVKNVALRPGAEDAVPRLHVDLVRVESDALTLEHARQQAECQVAESRCESVEVEDGDIEELDPASEPFELSVEPLELTAEPPETSPESRVPPPSDDAPPSLRQAPLVLDDITSGDINIISGEIDEPGPPSQPAPPWTALETVEVHTPLDSHTPIPLTRLKRDTVPRTRPSADELGLADPLEQSQWTFAGEGLDTEVEEDAFWERSGPSARTILIWLAALTMASIAVASALYTGLFDRAYAKVEAWFEGKEPATKVRTKPGGSAQLAHVNAHAVAPMHDKEKPADSKRLAKTELPAQSTTSSSRDAATPPNKRTSTKQAATKQAVSKQATTTPKPATTKQATTTPKQATTTPKPATTTPKPATTTPKPATTTPKSATTKRLVESKVASNPRRRAVSRRRDGRRLSIAIAGGQQRLSIPIYGSLSGARHYPLSNPNGLVVRLPAGKLAIAAGDYVIKRGPMRLLWARNSRKYGPQLRLMLRKGSTCRAKISASRVIFSCPLD
jgi:hypothetical protein